MTWWKVVAGVLVLVWSFVEWRASRRLRHIAREQERCRGRPPEPLSEESYTARLMGTVFAFVFACVLYQMNPDFLLGVSFVASVALLALWTLTR